MIDLRYNALQSRQQPFELLRPLSTTRSNCLIYHQINNVDGNSTGITIGWADRKATCLLIGVSHNSGTFSSSCELGSNLNYGSWQYVACFHMVLGYDNVSRVIAVGKNVTHIQPGSIVWTDLPHRETGLVSEERALRGLLFPAEEAQTVPYDVIETFIFSVRTRVALNAIHDASIVLGERVAVIGLGAVGLLVLQMARLNGANEVFCIDLFPKRLELAASFGGLPLLAREDPAYTIKQASSGIDVAIEASGSYAGLQTALRCCRIGGRVVTVSTYNDAGSDLFLGEEWSKNRLTLYSSMSVNGCPSRRYPLWDKDRLDMCARQVLKQGIVNTRSMITHRYSFEQAPEAYQMIEQQPGEVIQVLFQYEKERCEHV